MSTNRQVKGSPGTVASQAPAFNEESAGSGAVLNLKRVAFALGVHYMTAYRYVRTGLLPGERLGSEWRVRHSDVHAFLGHGRRSAAPARTRRPVLSTGGRVFRAVCSPATRSRRGSVVDAALAAGHDPTYCYLDMIASALESIGSGWSAGNLGDR